MGDSVASAGVPHWSLRIGLPALIMWLAYSLPRGIVMDASMLYLPVFPVVVAFVFIRRSSRKHLAGHKGIVIFCLAYQAAFVFFSPTLWFYTRCYSLFMYSYFLAWPAVILILFLAAYALPPVLILQLWTRRLWALSVTWALFAFCLLGQIMRSGPWHGFDFGVVWVT